MGLEDYLSRRLERRWALRYPFRTGLEIEWGSAVLRGNTRDISSNGMFIEVPDTLWVVAAFTVRLHLPQPVKLDCQVKRAEPARGMGASVAYAGNERQKAYHKL